MIFQPIWAFVSGEYNEFTQDYTTLNCLDYELWCATTRSNPVKVGHKLFSFVVTNDFEHQTTYIE